MYKTAAKFRARHPVKVRGGLKGRGRGSKGMACLLCGERTVNLLNHIAAKHPPVKCHYCGNLIRADKIKVHQRKDHGK